MSDITIYYKDSILRFGYNNTYQFTAPSAEPTSANLVYKGISYYIDSIIYDKNKSKLYVLHRDNKDAAKINQMFVLEIDISEDNRYPTEPTLNEYIPDPPASGTRPPIDIKALLEKSVKNDQANTRKIVYKGTNAQSKPVYICLIGTICVPSSVSIPFGKPSDNDFEKRIIQNTSLSVENADARIVISSTPKYTIGNCKRTDLDKGDNQIKQNKDNFLKFKSNNTLMMSIFHMTISFTLIAMVLAFHLLMKDPLTDIWGYPISEPGVFEELMTGGGASGGASGGARCYIPDEIPVGFPMPNKIAFLKIAAILFFVQTFIYGSIYNKVGWIALGTIVLTVFAIATVILHYVYNINYYDGMSIYNSFLFSEQHPYAKYCAIFMYMTFYTSFIRMITQNYGSSEITFFFVNYLVFAAMALGFLWHTPPPPKSDESDVFAIIGTLVTLTLGSSYASYMFTASTDSPPEPNPEKSPPPEDSTPPPQ